MILFGKLFRNDGKAALAFAFVFVRSEISSGSENGAGIGDFCTVNRNKHKVMLRIYAGSRFCSVLFKALTDSKG